MVGLKVGTVSAGDRVLWVGWIRGCRDYRDLFVRVPGGHLPAAKLFASRAGRRR